MPESENHFHYKIYKPYGYLSQFVNNGPKKNSKKLLGELANFPEGIMAIGRLDEKSEGLLLLTTDGKESNRIRSKNIEKEYYAQLDGAITDDALELLQKGVEIGFDGKKYQTLPCDAHKIEIPNLPTRGRKIRDDRHGPTSWISITICEGKFRQVRKMTSAVGFPTLRLVRIRVDTIYLDNMSAGEVIEMETLE